MFFCMNTARGHKDSLRLRTNMFLCLTALVLTLCGCGGTASSGGSDTGQETALSSGAGDSGQETVPSSDVSDTGKEDSASSGGSGRENGPDSGQLQAVFFDVGKGDCILLSMGEDHVLLDAGYEESSSEITQALAARGVTSLDAMIITHYDKDHVGGAAEIAQEIPVDIFYLPDYEGEVDKSGDLLALIQQQGLESVRVTQKESVPLGQVQIEVDPALVAYDAAEENDNDASLIVSIIYEEDEWLLPGDIEKDAIEIWLSENTRTFDILKMPHHGKKEGNTKELIQNVDPSIAVITDSAEDEANEKVLKQLDKNETDVFRTSVNGTITITGDGSGKYEIASEK